MAAWRSGRVTEGGERPTAASFHRVRLQSCISWEWSSSSFFLENYGFAVVFDLEAEEVVSALLVPLKTPENGAEPGTAASSSPTMSRSSTCTVPASGAPHRPCESSRWGCCSLRLSSLGGGSCTLAGATWQRRYKGSSITRNRDS